jgi:aminopeptidase-like protein
MTTTLDQAALIREVFPFRRDLVSDGYDAALDLLRQRFPLAVHRYPTGLPCWTWRVPPKWTCDEAWVETVAGERLIDQATNPLHVGSYSRSIDARLPAAELQAHLQTHPHVADAPPFLFHYYEDTWSFGAGSAIAHRLTDPYYQVRIQSRREPGHLKVGEWLLPGEREDCFVLCGHLCHPAQANDGLSGVVTGLAVMEALSAESRRRFTYRLLIVPETIGSVAWLSQHERLIPRMQGGLFLDMTGLDQPAALQLSYAGDTEIDRCFRQVHLAAEAGAWVAPYRGVVGNDERQFNAPGVRVPMLSYARALPWGHPARPYREYHSAADTPELVHAAALLRSRDTVLSMIRAWEANEIPVNQFKGEVFLSGFDLAVDRHRQLTRHRDMLRIMDCIDGTNTIAGIAERVALPFPEVREFVERLRSAGLVSWGGPLESRQRAVKPPGAEDRPAPPPPTRTTVLAGSGT